MLLLQTNFRPALQVESSQLFFDFDLLLLLRLGTFLPFLRASERPMAIACLRLFTVPPLPPLPLFSVPFLRRRMALFTSLPALRAYLAMFPPWKCYGATLPVHGGCAHSCALGGLPFSR